MEVLADRPACSTRPLTAAMRSTQLFRVKGTRSLERASQEWMELFRLREELTRRVDAGAIRPVFWITISVMPRVRSS